jgi:signal transduction histidine kinase
VQLEVGQRLGPTADWQELIDDVLVDVSRLDRLVDDLLALARLDESHGNLLRSGPVELRPLIESIVGRYAHARVPVDLAAGPELVVDGDQDGLHRVVLNLIDNAVRYATKQVRVTLDRGDLNGTDAAVLTVVDDGPGIPAEERKRVFDRFYRLHSSRSRDTGGTGLGLAIVRDVVGAHHGTIWLSAREDGKPGLSATVRLPLAR